MKKKMFLVLALVLAFTMVFAACNNSTPAPADPAPAPAPAPADTSDAEEEFAATPEVTLILTQHDPDASLPGKYCNDWAEAVYQASKGRIKVEVHNGGDLAKPAESLDKVRDGSVDLAWGLQSFYGGQFPLTDGLSLPYLPYSDAAHASAVMMDIYESGMLDAEYSDVKVLLIRANCDAPIITASKKLDTAADLKGMTIRATAAPLVSWLGEFGAGAQGCPINELYQNLQQGTFNGALTDWHGVDSFKLYEVAKFYADEQVQYNTYYFLMNKGSYDKLSDENKAVIDSLSGQNALAINLNDWDDLTAGTKTTIEQNGGEVYKLSDDEHAKLVAAAEKVTQDWVAANGDAGKALYDKIIELS